MASEEGEVDRAEFQMINFRTACDNKNLIAASLVIHELLSRCKFPNQCSNEMTKVFFRVLDEFGGEMLRFDLENSLHQKCFQNLPLDSKLEVIRVNMLRLLSKTDRARLLVTAFKITPDLSTLVSVHDIIQLLHVIESLFKTAKQNEELTISVTSSSDSSFMLYLTLTRKLLFDLLLPALRLGINMTSPVPQRLDSDTAQLLFAKSLQFAVCYCTQRIVEGPNNTPRIYDVPEQEALIPRLWQTVCECFDELVSGMGWQSLTEVRLSSHRVHSSLPLLCYRLERICRKYIDKDYAKPQPSQTSDRTGIGFRSSSAESISIRSFVSPILSMSDVENDQQGEMQARAIGVACTTLLLECACKWLSFSIPPFVPHCHDEDDSRSLSSTGAAPLASLNAGVTDASNQVFSESEPFGRIPLLLMPSDAICFHNASSFNTSTTSSTGSIKSDKRKISSSTKSPIYLVQEKLAKRRLFEATNDISQGSCSTSSRTLSPTPTPTPTTKLPLRSLEPVRSLSGCVIGTLVTAWAAELVQTHIGDASATATATACSVIGVALDENQANATFLKEKTRLAHAADLLDAAVRCTSLLKCHPSIEREYKIFMEEIIPKNALLWAWFSVFEIDIVFYRSQWDLVISRIMNLKKTFPALSLLQSVLFKARFDLMFAICYLQKDNLLAAARFAMSGFSKLCVSELACPIESLPEAAMELVATELPRALERAQYTSSRFEMVPLATPFVLPFVVHTLLAHFKKSEVSRARSPQMLLGYALVLSQFEWPAYEGHALHYLSQIRCIDWSLIEKYIRNVQILGELMRQCASDHDMLCVNGMPTSDVESPSDAASLLCALLITCSSSTPSDRPNARVYSFLFKENSSLLAYLL